MKRTLLTLLQVGVTFLLLWWIFKDPEKREHMAGALRAARLFVAHSRSSKHRLRLCFSN